MDWRHLGELLTAGEGVYTELKNLCVWVKDNGGMDPLYDSKHELVLVWKVGAGKRPKQRELRRERPIAPTSGTTLVSTPSVRDGFRTSPPIHRKARGACGRRDKSCSRRGDVILDPFWGPGRRRRGHAAGAVVPMPWKSTRSMSSAAAVAVTVIHYSHSPGNRPDLRADLRATRYGTTDGQSPIGTRDDQTPSPIPGLQGGLQTPSPRVPFKKGQSGNLNGRPRGASNIKNTINKILLKPVLIRGKWRAPSNSCPGRSPPKGSTRHCRAVRSS